MKDIFTGINGFFAGAKSRARRVSAAAAKRIRNCCGDTPLFFAAMGAAIPVVLCGELIGAVTHRGVGLMDMIMLFLSVLMCGYLVGVRKKPAGAPAALLLAYTAWLVVTRVLLGDTGLGESVHRIGYVAFGSVVAFCLPQLVGSERMRQRLQRAIMLFLICVCTVISLGTLLVALLGIGADGGLGESIYFSDDGHRLKFLHIYSTIIGIYDLLGVLSAIIGAVWAKKKGTKAAFAVCALFITTMHSVVDARASYIVGGACAGMIAALLLYELLKTKKLTRSAKLDTAIRWAVCAAVAVGLVFCTAKYMSFASGVLVDASNKYRENHAASQAAHYQGSLEMQEEQFPGAYEDNNGGSDEVEISIRGFSLDNLLTLTARTYVYEYGVRNLMEHPKTLIMGELYKGEAFLIEGDDGFVRSYAHFHSSLLTTVYETGLPGLLMMLAFCVLTAVRGIRVFFNIGGKYKRHDRMTVLFAAGIMIIALIEPIIFSAYDAADQYTIAILFAFFSGCIHAMRPEVAVSADGES